MSEPVKLRQLGVFASPEQMASILALRDSDPARIPEAINSAAHMNGLPQTPKGYGISIPSREFIGPADEEPT